MAYREQGTRQAGLPTEVTSCPPTSKVSSGPRIASLIPEITLLQEIAVHLISESLRPRQSGLTARNGAPNTVLHTAGPSTSRLQLLCASITSLFLLHPEQNSFLSLLQGTKCSAMKQNEITWWGMSL